jgi:hypothetical protein
MSLDLPAMRTRSMRRATCGRDLGNNWEDPPNCCGSVAFHLLRDSKIRWHHWNAVKAAAAECAVTIFDWIVGR